MPQVMPLLMGVEGDVSMQVQGLAHGIISAVQSSLSIFLQIKTGVEPLFLFFRKKRVMMTLECPVDSAPLFSADCYLLFAFC